VCVLRAYGAEFDPDEFLEGSELTPAFVFRRGELQIPELEEGPQHEMSGIHFTVSEASWQTLVGQVEDAEQYLKTHTSDLLRLVAFRGVEQVSLDFPLDLRLSQTTWMQSDRFPARLAKLAGDIGIDLEFSIYSEEEV
jgi:hypothetical protein